MEDSDFSSSSAWREDSTSELQPSEAATRTARSRRQSQHPTVLGRYRVHEPLGEGATGIVYAAEDPELGRRVAIKLLHSNPQHPKAAERLKREARALASLSHPNVVTIYDVGTVEREGQEALFIAMALIEGQTLGRWLAERKPSWRETLNTVMQAGRGLAAAHRAGLVHRDFKPDNVLIRDDGVPIVVDFGLARSVTASADPVPADPVPADPVSADPVSADTGLFESGVTDSSSIRQTQDPEITRAGTLIGSPLYMAPECLEGENHAQADQFSFCVTLYEALYGQKPFAGDRLSSLFQAKLAGETLPPPARADVPACLHRMVLRGLQPRSEHRWPSMDALLRAIERDPGKKRRAFATLAFLILVLISLGWSLSTWWQGSKEEPLIIASCEEGLSWEAAWDEQRKRRLREVFANTGAVYAEETWTRVEATLDSYVSDGSRLLTRTCLAHREGKIREATLHRRMACLADRKDEFKALLDIFQQADTTILS